MRVLGVFFSVFVGCLTSGCVGTLPARPPLPTSSFSDEQACAAAAAAAAAIPAGSVARVTGSGALEPVMGAGFWVVFEPVSFNEVCVGDLIAFFTPDTGRLSVLSVKRIFPDHLVAAGVLPGAVPSVDVPPDLVVKRVVGTFWSRRTALPPALAPP